MSSLGPGEYDIDFAALATGLLAAGSVTATLQQIVDLAVESIEGCSAAGIVLVEGDRVLTRAFSDPLTLELDGLQIHNQEGPCLEAASQGGTYYAEDLAGDHRWPHFGPAAAAAGFRSALAFGLPGSTRSALNLYCREPNAFGLTDRAKGFIFAIVAGVALGSAEGREGEAIAAENLRQALHTRELIGQAQGILMERERISADQAFDVLRRASQHLNVKLREVAQRLVETGEDPDTGSIAGPR